MNRTIYKYKLQVADVNEVEMPQGAKILSLQVQYRELCMWAMVDPEQPSEKRRFLMYGTGKVIQDGEHLNYIGTCLMYSESLVVHIFEATNR